MWSPDSTQGSRDLVATAGDHLRLWNLSEDQSSLEGGLNSRMEAVLRNVRSTHRMHIRVV